MTGKYQPFLSWSSWDDGETWRETPYLSVERTDQNAPTQTHTHNSHAWVTITHENGIKERMSERETIVEKRRGIIMASSLLSRGRNGERRRCIKEREDSQVEGQTGQAGVILFSILYLWLTNTCGNLMKERKREGKWRSSFSMWITDTTDKMQSWKER